MRALLKFRSAQAAVVALAAIGVFTATNAAAAINSNIYIDARETFVLGGKQPGDFTVKGQNKGGVTVEVFARADGTSSLLATIAPGEKFEQDFRQGEGALLRNTSGTERAHLKVRVTGTTRNLGMSYQDW
ncbi:hypothetical protein [Erythrobacter sp. MTPC3]|uniref:hypothetical protein n=1 Tax=Erythrobacter sp. MTPC3 TaxID=3056564 RepID=UPI0036F28523